jgi:GNAT superfamily N-acetyltransferase
MYGESVRLPDGAEIMVRSVLPQDADRLAFDLEHLSALSRYRRFRAPVSRLSPDQLRDATHVDHVTHEALVALSPDAHDDIGLARFAVDPRDPRRAEVDLVVADSWQHRGVGRVLIEKIAARARAAGVERFTATMLAGNEAARATIEKVADIVAVESDGAVAVVTARLRETV